MMNRFSRGQAQLDLSKSLQGFKVILAALFSSYLLFWMLIILTAEEGER